MHIALKVQRSVKNPFVLSRMVLRAAGFLLLGVVVGTIVALIYAPFLLKIFGLGAESWYYLLSKLPIPFFPS